MDHVKKYPDLYKVSRAAAEQFITLSVRAIAERGKFNVALSGGETPETMYALLATEAYAPRVNWEKVHIFWSDERCVDPAHIDSNYRMAFHALIKHVPIPEENIHRIQGELKQEDAIETYETELKEHFKELPRFDLLLLGMADDGHIASLFPYETSLKETTRWVAADFVDTLRSWRITLTLPVINNAENITFLVVGEKKARIVSEVFDGAKEPEKYPAQLIQPKDGRLVWLLDQAAASLLPN